MSMKQKPGRKLSSVWINFKRDNTNPQNVKAQCKRCGKKMSGCSDRLVNHLPKCPNADAEIDEDLLDEESEEEQEVTSYGKDWKLKFNLKKPDKLQDNLIIV